MKFNILSMAMHPEMGRRIDDAYVYAWDNNVYPIFHDGASWHQAFEDDFDVTKEMMDELSARLDKAWDGGQGTAPTFYELESLYDARHGGGDWDRSALIGAMRYMALCQHRFDKKFFQQVTRNSGAPAEANHFADPMDRDSDIFFM
ncbi:hypothetical protein FJ937_11860 [Mesorhizobium sp. B2-4-4]|uniref:hypothetical protein n=1 Tax=Mesorhizobium sp. B2-4-4 TaxID=2589945 RepID=UPI00112631FC|nr:hypothetical protein [Mesorhizobium sp. B2-4-4]TPL52051.1 hypothetical protein FJ937_11860 [Mesorhizobium sp. B2-4-4]